MLAQWLRTTWAALQRLHEDDARQSSALSDLDAVCLEFDRATSALGIGERIRGGLEAHIGSLQSQVGIFRFTSNTSKRRDAPLAEFRDELEDRRGVIRLGIVRCASGREGPSPNLAAGRSLRLSAQSIDSSDETTVRWDDLAALGGSGEPSAGRNNRR